MPGSCAIREISIAPVPAAHPEIGALVLIVVGRVRDGLANHARGVALFPAFALLVCHLCVLSECFTTLKAAPQPRLQPMIQPTQSDATQAAPAAISK